MEITIRSVKAKDLSSLNELYSQSVDNDEYRTQNANIRAYAMYNKDLVKVAIAKDKMIGYIISYVSNPKKAKLYSIFVVDSYRKQGIGKKLLLELQKVISKKFNNIKYLSVRIPEINKDSSSFFHQMDFKTITKINNYRKNDLTFPFTVNNSIIVRQAQKNDLDGIIAIETKCFSEFWQMDKLTFFRIMKNPMNSLNVAFLNNEIVGYNYNTIVGSDGNYVRIATSPEFKRKKVATTLTAIAFSWFNEKHVNQVLLSTYADSSQHNKMYGSWGFKKLDQEEIMAKQFD